MDERIIRFSIELPPFIVRRQEHEIERASRARTEKRQKVKTIKSRFPSVNTMYPINRRAGRKYLSDEGRLWKAYLGEALDDILVESIPPWDFYDVSYVFFMTHEMMFKKNGELAEHDVSNFLKGTEDALFEWLEESDCQVMGVRGYKRLTVNDPSVVVMMSESSESDLIYHKGKSFEPYGLETDGSILRRVR